MSSIGIEYLQMSKDQIRMRIEMHHNPNDQTIMKDGMRYQIHMCAMGDDQIDQEHMKEQIADALECMSSQSRWQRFASPIIKLSDSQLNYLTDLDKSDRVAWCASIQTQEGDRGIGLARYARLADEEGVAEFAVTVVDEFQGQGIGYGLLNRLIETARENRIEVLRGYILPSNKPMLELCKKFEAVVRREDSSTLVADIVISKDAADE